jgi:hypothetical protein
MTPGGNAPPRILITLQLADAARASRQSKAPGGILTMKRLELVLAAASLVLMTPPAVAQADNPCAGEKHCTAVPGLTATITDFRESVGGYSRFVTFTVRFRNTSSRPLMLGLVRGSAVTTDDRGNRYATGTVRGIGEIAGNTFDSKFMLRPGESGDARIETGWRPGRTVYGTAFEIDLAVREIDVVGSNQFALGKEHALHWSGFGAAPAVAAVPAPVTEPRAEAPPPEPCPETKNTWCQAGVFVAEVSRLTTSKAGYSTLLQFTIRIRNLSGQPLVLAYTAGSAVVVDDAGNRYASNDALVRGIGLSRGHQVNASFALRPRESRDASFTLGARLGRAVAGSSFTFDFSAEQLEILPGNQIRSAREFAVGFRDLTASGPGAAEAAQAGARLLEGITKKIGKP